MVSRFISTVLAGVLLFLAGCGSGGSNSPEPSPPVAQGCDDSSCGTLMLGITDADGDFLSYRVDVESLTLRRANGIEVQALPVATRVDFAELVDLTEFVTAATVPNGVYVEGTLRLDYSNAEVTVEAGGEPRAATVVDSNGQPLGVVDVRVVLDNRNHIFIAPGRPAWLELDFDLAVSHTVDTTADPVRAVAQPFVLASVDPVDEKEMRVRGPLLRVDTAASAYTIDVRPFDHASARLGRFTVNTTAQTIFEIDGETFTGAAGLSALAALGVGAPTAAFGTFARVERSFTAQRVHAGSSVPGSRFDALRGNVIARDGNTLTVRGATLIRASGSITFIRDDITLLVGPETGVTRDGRAGTDLGIEAISVGQRINAFGQADESTTGDVTFDATEGRVRLHLTHLTGSVVSANPGALVLNLHSIDGRRPATFDFSGTGTTPGSDADPANYEIATSTLGISLLETDSPTRVFGFVTAFGAAPPDFEGRTVIDFSNVRAYLAIGWGLEGTSAPFLTLGTEGITLDMDNPGIGARHHVVIGPRIIDLQALATPASIVPADGRGLFAIAQGRRVEVFGSFADFTARLAALLGGGAEALALHASGTFEPSTATLTASQVAVRIE
jgi:hypothetical protein